MADDKAAGQGIVGVQDQLRIGVDGGENSVKHALRMAVPGQLVPVQVGNDELRGVEVFEAVGGIALVAFQQQHVGVDLPPQGGVGQDQCGDALYLIGAFGVVNDVLPLPPQHRGDHLHRGGLAVGAGNGDDMGGSCTRFRMSGQIFRANLPGMELPLPTSLPTNRPSLQTTIAKNFRMNILLSAFIFQPDHQRRQVGGADARDTGRLSQIHGPHGESFSLASSRRP